MKWKGEYVALWDGLEAFAAQNMADAMIVRTSFFQRNAAVLADRFMVMDGYSARDLHQILLPNRENKAHFMNIPKIYEILREKVRALGKEVGEVDRRAVIRALHNVLLVEAIVEYYEKQLDRFIQYQESLDRLTEIW